MRLHVLRCVAAASPTRLRVQTALKRVRRVQVADKEGGGAGAKREAFPFSDPFIMELGENETVGQLKTLVQRDMGVSDEEFATWRVALIS
jgi:hypothetical protein